MSDSSEEEDLSKFKEAVDNSFSINNRMQKDSETSQSEKKNLKSERYLEIASHYNDVIVSKQLQKQIGAKLSALINKNIEYVDINQTIKKPKIKGGVKLFRDSESYLSCEEEKDNYTVLHNSNSKKLNKKRKCVDGEAGSLTNEQKINAVALSADYILSKKETKCWKSRRKEKVFKYRKGKNNVLCSIE